MTEAYFNVPVHHISASSREPYQTMAMAVFIDHGHISMMALQRKIPSRQPGIVSDMLDYFWGLCETARKEMVTLTVVSLKIDEAVLCSQDVENESICQPS